MIWIKINEPVDEKTFERTLAAAVGIDIVDDGEYGKVNWITYITERVRGLEHTENFALKGGTAGRGEQAVLLGGRFAVSVSGNPGDPEALKSALDGLDLKGVEGLGKP